MKSVKATGKTIRTATTATAGRVKTGTGWRSTNRDHPVPDEANAELLLFGLGHDPLDVGGRLVDRGLYVAALDRRHDGRADGIAALRDGHHRRIPQGRA